MLPLQGEESMGGFSPAGEGGRQRGGGGACRDHHAAACPPYPQLLCSPSSPGFTFYRSSIHTRCLRH